MAKFIDGAGKEHVFKLRMRSLKAVKEKFDLDIEAVYRAAYIPPKGAEPDTTPLLDLLYGNQERLAAIIVEICEIPPTVASQVIDDMDEDSFDNGRELLMEMLGSFCLPPAMRGQVLAAFRKAKTADLNHLLGSNSGTDSPES